MLTQNEMIAIKNVEDYASGNNEQSLRAIRGLLKRYKMENIDIDAFIDKIFNKKITINFHPDLLTEEDNLVLESFLEEGVYQNQFVTKISNGHLSVQNDDRRDKWEKDIFCLEMPLPANQRPKYGGLNVFNYLDGASPKYGSCYFELNESITSRCTFLIADTQGEMRKKGTRNSFYTLLLSVILEIIKTGQLFGKKYSNVTEFFADMNNNYIDTQREMGGNVLDYGLEAQIHGTVDFDRDIDFMYIDQSYVGSVVHDLSEEISRRYKIYIKWIPERRVTVDKILHNCSDEELKLLLKELLKISPINYINAKILGYIRILLRDNKKHWLKYADETQWNRCLRKIWRMILANYTRES